MARKKEPTSEAPASAKKQPKEDLIGSIVSAIRASAPKKGDAGSIYVARMNQAEKIFSAIREVVTTGIAPYDDIIGPIPKGRILEVFGPEASGKSEFIKKVVKRAYQKELCIYNPDGTLEKMEDDLEVVILYFDNEHSIISDTNEIVIDGVKIDGILTECDVIEDMWKEIDITLDKVKAARKNEEEKVKRAQKDGKTYKPKKFLTVVVVDTIASMTSVEEYTADWGDQDYPRMPKKLKEGFRKMVRRIGNENVIFIASNQANEKFQKRGYGPTPLDQKFNSPGGKALKFFASTRVCFEQQPIKFVLDEEYKFQQGYVVAFMSTKNRIKKPLREGRMVLLFDSAPNIYGEMTPSGLNNEFSILETLLFLKFVEFGDDRYLRFKFRELEIPLTTFEGLDPDEDPVIPARSDWVNFYAAHKADVDAMWAMAVDYIHKDRGSTNVKAIKVEADQLTGEEDVQEQQEQPSSEEPPRAPRVRGIQLPGSPKGGVLTVPE